MQRLIISLVGLAVTLLLIAAPGLAGPPLTQTKEKNHRRRAAQFSTALPFGC